MTERLFPLLPTTMQLRDAAAGSPLRALLGVIDGEVVRIEDNITELYDDWFVETCSEWVVPYLGDLLGARGFYVFDDAALSLRPFVANTLGFRRRKGTAAMLEDLTAAATGWTACAVEMFRHVATTLHVNHPRTDPATTLSVRGAGRLELVGAAFDPTRRTVDVHRIATLRGRHNLPNIAIFVWRVPSFEATSADPLTVPAALRTTGVAAVADPGAGPGRFRFGQLGADLPLHGSARHDAGTFDPTLEPDVPGPLRPRALWDEVMEARRAVAAGEPLRFRFLDPAAPVLRIHPVGEATPIAPEAIQVCNLSGWTTAPAPQTVQRPDGSTLTTRVAVDPARGRLVFVSGATPTAVRVAYHLGFPAELGGGFYSRPEPPPVAAAALATVNVSDWSVADSLDLGAALAAWAAAGRPDRVIELADSGSYALPATLTIPAGGSLQLRAADNHRPILRLPSSWAIALGAGARLELDGLVIAGAAIEVTAVAGAAVDHTLALRHCTLVPGLRLDPAGNPAVPAARSLVTTAASAGRLAVSLTRCITGAIDLTAGGDDFTSDVKLVDSIVDGLGAAAPAIAVADLGLDAVTVLGAIAATTLHASDCVLDGDVAIARTQTGCVRFSWLAPGTKAPRAYRCQPALALAKASAADQPSIVARLRPAYTSERYPDPAYAQLSSDGPAEIAAGASDGGEMGAYHHLHQPQRLANLRSSLDEYLRFGLEAGVFFAS